MKAIELSNKDFDKLLPIMVENQISFRYVEKVREKKKPPQKWMDALDEYLGIWNGDYAIPGLNHTTKRYKFKKTRKVNKALKEKREKIYRKLYDSQQDDPVSYALSLAIHGIKKYIDNIKSRKPGDSFYEHRWYLVDFLGRKHGLGEFAYK